MARAQACASRPSSVHWGWRRFRRTLRHMTVFVGRADELAALSETVSAAVRGGVAAAIVVGDAGSGKSRLLAEARDRVIAPKRLAVIGYEAERNVPLAAASSLLRTLFEVPRH